MSSANSPDWQMARLRRETVESLRKLIPGLDRGLEMGRNHFYEYPGDQGWSVDKIIQVLVAREERKRERSRKYPGKKRPGHSGRHLILDEQAGTVFGDTAGEEGTIEQGS